MCYSCPAEEGYLTLDFDNEINPDIYGLNNHTYLIIGGEYPIDMWSSCIVSGRNFRLQLNFHKYLKIKIFILNFRIWNPLFLNDLKSFVGRSPACENCVPETWQTSPLWGWTNYWSLNIKDDLSGGDISGTNRINYESGVEWSWNLEVLIFFR